jgi:hypothetical protein
MGAPDVVLTWPAKRGSAPAVAWRFVQRLAADPFARRGLLVAGVSTTGVKTRVLGLEKVSTSVVFIA